MMIRCLSFLLLLLLTSLHSMAVLTAEVGIYSPPHCAYADGKLYVNAQGGAWCAGCLNGYHILWNTGDTTAMIYNVPAGTYSVIITDDSMNVAYDTLVVAAENFTAYIDFLTMCPDTGTGPEFEGFIRGWSGVLMVNQMIGYGPHNLTGGYTEVLYTDTFNLSYWDTVYHIIPPVAWGPPGNGGQITYTDAFGCPGTIDWTVPYQTFAYDPVQVLQLDGSCTGMNNGQLRLAVTPMTTYPSEPMQGLVKSDGTPVAWNESLGSGGSIQYIYRTLSAGDYAYVQHYGAFLGVYPPWLEFLGPWFSGSACADSVWVTIPDNGSTCGTLSGKAYVDSDENCNAIFSEARIPGMVMEIQPGNHYTITGAQGNYSINLPVGSGYTVAQQTTLYDEHCFGGLAFNITAGSYVTRDHADTSLTGMDAKIAMGSGPARPGFTLFYSLDFQNLTATNAGPSSVTIVLDPAITLSYASVAPSSIVGNTLTWNYANIIGFSYGSIDLWCQVPPDPLLIGTTLTTTATLGTATTDIDLSNNTFTHQVLVTGRFDPNDKSVTPGDHFVIDEDSTLTYTIRFQNTGTDTAFLVVVVDSLPAEVDPGSFEMLAASHNYSLTMQGQGVLRWMFPFILLPDSNTNEARSHGFVTFRVRPRLPLLPGTTISNAADIYFDYNPPVHTNDAVVVAEFSTQEQGQGQEQGQASVWPNPARDAITIVGVDEPIASVIVLAADGREVLRTNGGDAAIPVRSLAAGSYMARATCADGSVLSLRFVKQ